MIEQRIDYEHDGTQLEGYLAYDDTGTAPKPAVLIAHAWRGRSDFECARARALAELGYIGFAADLYGKGVLGGSPEESARLMQAFLDDRTRLQNHLLVALEALRGHPGVDAGRVAAIGFCFGGLCVLDLARCGAGINGVVSFHGLLSAPDNTNGKPISAKVLVLHGHDDPMAPVGHVLALQRELDAAGADWHVHVYGRTLHSFTNPAANDAAMGTVYNPSADHRSWSTLLNFLAETLE